MSEPEDTDDGPTGPSDDDLMAMGLAPTRAWVRANATGQARRNRRYRERAAAQGQRQLSATVPEEARDTVRQICRRLCDGDLSVADLAALQASAARRSEAEKAQEAAPLAVSRNDNKRILRQILALTAISLAAFAAGMTIASGMG